MTDKPIRTVFDEELRLKVMDYLKKAYFNARTDVVAERNGVVPDQSHVIPTLENLADELESALKTLLLRAEINALDDAYGYWHMHGGRKTGKFIKERIGALQTEIDGKK